MDLGLRGGVAVVAGSASGLGLAIAEAFAAEGAALALLDRDPSVADVASRLAASKGVPVEAYQIDVSEYDEVRDASERVFQRFGRCDHLVDAAAVGSGRFGFPFWKLQPADWDRVLRVNLMGAVHLLHAFGPVMAEARRGSVLLIASVAGQIGSQTDPPYSASKAALINFAQCAAKDLAAYGVRVNALNPGMVRTPLNRGVYDAWARDQPETGRPDYETWAAEKIGKVIPLGRWQEPEDVAAMAIFLASDRASNVTGQAINVDGGFVMHS